MRITNFGSIPSQKKWLPGWNYGKEIVIPANSIDGNLTNFPCTVYLDSTNFDFNKAKADGSDIRFTDNNLNHLKFERKEHPYKIFGIREHKNYVDYTPDMSVTFSTDNITINSPAGNYLGGCWLLLPIKRSEIINGNCTKLVMDFLTYQGGGSTVSVAYLDDGFYDYTSSSDFPDNGSSPKKGSGISRQLYAYQTVARAERTFTLDATGMTEEYVTLKIGLQDGWSYQAYCTIYSLKLKSSLDVIFEDIDLKSLKQQISGTVSDRWLISSKINPNGSAIYNVQIPLVSDLVDTKFYIWYGNTSAYNTSIEAWQDQTGKQLTYNGDVKIQRSKVSSPIEQILDFNTGTFSNHTKTIISGADTVNGTQGISIYGRSSASPETYASNLKCEFSVNMTEYDKFTFYVRKVSDHGVCQIRIDGIIVFNISYSTLSTAWTKYEVNLSQYVGIHTLGLVGGYVDSSGFTYSETRYCDARLVAEGRSFAKFDGSGDYFTTSSNINYEIGANEDFCIEAIIKYASINTLGIFQTETNISGSTGTFWFGYEGGKLALGKHGSGTYTTGYTWTPIINTVYNICATRSGGTTRFFIDGTLVATSTLHNALSFTQNGIAIGVLTTPSYLNGSLYGVRFTKGRARYISNFTPPTSFSIDGSDVVFCTNFDTIYDSTYIMVQHMGNTLIDASGYGNNGTATGTTIVNTEYGLARRYTGATQYIDYGTKMLLGSASNDDFTILSLAKAESAIGTEFWLYSQYVSAANRFIYNIHTDGKQRYFVGSVGTLYSSTAVSSGSPFVFSVSKDINSLIKFYLDGIANGSSTLNSTLEQVSISSGNEITSTTGTFIQYSLRVSSINRSDPWIKAESLSLKKNLLTIKDL